ncbi:hypothetical protein Q8A73_017702 [Channa argus]|nr:hypothetical protein Q8A73_017702 [Channa argus]
MFGGGGDDIERNPKASGSSIGRGGGGCCRWLENKRTDGEMCLMWSSVFSFCLSPQHLCWSLRIRDVTTFVVIIKPSCARGPDPFAPRNSSWARTFGSLNRVPGLDVLPVWARSRSV